MEYNHQNPSTTIAGAADDEDRGHAFVVGQLAGPVDEGGDRLELARDERELRVFALLAQFRLQYPQAA